MKVLIDTNGLLIPGQFGVDIFAELRRLGYNEFLIPECVVRELHGLRLSARGRDRTAVNIALSLLERCRIVEDIPAGSADETLEKMAVESGASVLTNDAQLKKRLCSKGISVIYLREKSHLST